MDFTAFVSFLPGSHCIFEIRNHVFSKPEILKLTLKYKVTGFEYIFCVCSKLVNFYDSDYVFLCIS